MTDQVLPNDGSSDWHKQIGDMVPSSPLVIHNAVLPRGKPEFKLWIDGPISYELVIELMNRWPERAYDATIGPDYTIMRFISRIDNVVVSELVSPNIFVLQGDRDAKILYINTNLTDEQAQKMRQFLARVRMIETQSTQKRLR